MRFNASKDTHLETKNNLSSKTASFTVQTADRKLYYGILEYGCEPSTWHCHGKDKCDSKGYQVECVK